MSSVTASETIVIKPGKLKMVALDDIVTDGGTQMRERLDDSVVGDYSRKMLEGVEFPQLVVYFDGSTYWLADGFHRYFAATMAGHVQINCEVRAGTKRDAILHAIGANSEHGKQRSPEDKRRAVAAMLNDEEWATWPQTKIAAHCGVSQQLVSKVATDAIDASYHRSKMRDVTRNGTTYQQDTTNIGKKSAVAAKSPSRDDEGHPAEADVAPDEEPEEAEEALAIPRDFKHTGPVHSPEDFTPLPPKPATALKPMPASSAAASATFEASTQICVPHDPARCASLFAEKFGRNRLREYAAAFTTYLSDTEEA